MTEQMTPRRLRMLKDMALRNMAPIDSASLPANGQELQPIFRRSPDKQTFEDVRTWQPC